MKNWARKLAAIVSLWQAAALAQETPPTLPETVIEAESPGGTGNPAAGTDAPPQGAPNSEPFTNDLADRIAAIGRESDGFGVHESASAGVYGRGDLAQRPLLRPASVLDLIPGFVATQHSGSGKANQYFVRGVNLDHGTDFSVRVDGVPMNLPTHGHGQGYLDLNWLIPELIDSVNYRLGTYYADVGDFSSVGSADIAFAKSLPQNYAAATAGSFDYYRALAINNTDAGLGRMLYAFEYVENNGPWEVPERYRKFNAVTKYSEGDELEGFSLSCFAYRGYWNATNQVAQRAVDAGVVGRFGSLDPTDGGMTDRVTLNAALWQDDGGAVTRANAYIAYYDLNLYSNFTYFLDDPVNGDQIRQHDQRVYGGFNLSREWRYEFSSNTLGAQFRNDSIANVSLDHTAQREIVNPVSENRVDQQNFSLYGVNKMQLTQKVRSELGIRGDLYRFRSDDLIDPANDGDTVAGILSPKTSLIYAPSDDWELYANWGLAFHSNDARGVNAAVDPASPLVRSNGSEIGTKFKPTENWTTTLSLWYLTIDSELVFVGDAGTTEPSAGSHRGGFNTTNFFRLNDWCTLDIDYAYVRPRFDGGDRIPNAVENVISSGLNLGDPRQGWFGSARVQSYGTAALIEDNSARSDMTTIVNLQVGRAWEKWRFTADIFNLLDTQANDIVYYYESAPQGFPPALDYHFHPVIPASVRFTASCVY